MSHSLRVPTSNIEPVNLLRRVRVTSSVGAAVTRALLLIRRDGYAFRRCRCCGKMLRVDPADSR